jgi:hypothetical protein
MASLDSAWLLTQKDSKAGTQLNLCLCFHYNLLVEFTRSDSISTGKKEN